MQPPNLQSTGRHKGSRGRGTKGSRGKGDKGKGGKDERPLKKSLKQYVKEQKRKRFHRHLQRICGTKQIWEVLVFSGRFDVEALTEALGNGDEEEPRVQERQPLMERRSARLHHEKAEAIARYKEGERI